MMGQRDTSLFPIIMKEYRADPVSLEASAQRGRSARPGCGHIPARKERPPQVPKYSSNSYQPNHK
jgi:hypothetical protein